ncbi:uncharacterized protein ARMOST_18111 [Armillaria ostoyae]|uniref:Uncharacterized protein n=1 Tax=Armillaria ostoyae TaxID=47428 RepID=A0A284S123_ARMOS|nr:uncharacterized protein ARMOST_18111 [Armillaria ostoyae]
MLTITAFQVSFPKYLVLVEDHCICSRPRQHFLNSRLPWPLRLTSSLNVDEKELDPNSIGSAHTTSSLLPSLRYHQSLQLLGLMRVGYVFCVGVIIGAGPHLARCVLDVLVLELSPVLSPSDSIPVKHTACLQIDSKAACSLYSGSPHIISKGSQRNRGRADLNHARGTLSMGYTKRQAGAIVLYLAPLPFMLLLEVS